LFDGKLILTPAELDRWRHAAQQWVDGACVPYWCAAVITSSPSLRCNEHPLVQISSSAGEPLVKSVCFPVVLLHRHDLLKRHATLFCYWPSTPDGHGIA